MATVTLNATPRTAAGKGAARKLRKAGRIPVVLYGGGRPVLQAAVDPHEVELAFHKTNDPNTLLAVQIDGSEHLCLVREVQRHPVSGHLVHLDLYEVGGLAQVTVSVPVVLVGRAVGTRLGGLLNQVVRRVSVRCSPQAIPAAIQVDVTPLKVGQAVKVSEIVPPAGCTLVYDADFAVAEVVGTRAEATEAKPATA